MEPDKVLRLVLFWSLVAAGFAIVMISSALGYFWASFGGKLAVDELTVFLDAYKAVGVGFLVAVLGVVLPQLLSASRYRFEHFKESRIAYSKAKTAIMYLSASIAKLPYGDAIDKVREAHEHLHLAESYEELTEHLRHDSDPETWGERKYWELTAFRIAVSENADQWDRITGSQRLKLLAESIATVEDAFKDLRPRSPRRMERSFLDTARQAQLVKNLRALSRK